MKHNQYKKIIGILLIVVFLAQASPVLATRTVLTVPQYDQRPQTYLCWATSAAMVISCFKNDTTNRKIAIAQDKFGTTNYDQPATLEDTKSYVNSYTNKSGSIRNNSLTYTAVQYQIGNGGPIVSRVLISGGMGHQMVIKGFDTSTNYVIYNDPADGTGHGATYSWYCSNSQWQWNRSLFFY